ncbi:hypothetical protein M422DRAFT_270694 [Sphaerobolus stellatus SS14]|uniref:NACHT domain-containing protein n=1 Tax=Sphaerobolus stellatus (strain SS14) TaxID=990650 RepID=A0A0C9U1V4_SPHS4|nr:hypothetical protein M422DRAFT_270694 [Sphaerobolus stellatus SS14]
MDPLSISASIVGFLQFTGQIGTTLSKFIQADKDAKKAITELQDEINYLERIVNELKSLIHDHSTTLGNSIGDFSQLQVCLDKCIVQLKDFIDEIKPPVSKWTRKGLKNRIKWILKDEEKQSLVNLVSQHKNSLHFELTARQSRTIHQMRVAQTEQYRDKIIQWLDIVEVSSNYDRARSNCHTGTGQWFLQGQAFKEYKNNSGNCVWLYGKAGCGKTILSGSIIDDLKNHVKLEANSTTVLAYFFFSYTDDKKQTVYNMLSSIAAQLCKRIQNIPSEVVSLYKENITRPPSSVLLSIIKCISRLFRKTYIVLDALDEVSFPERDPILDVLRELVWRSGLSNPNLLLTSRREPYLEAGIGHLGFEEICLTTPRVDEDIKLYVSETVAREARFSKWSDTLKMEIIEILITKADGMFRWVECQIETLKGCLRPCDARDALYSLPETLDETYKRILLGVQKKYRVYAARLLAWVVFTSEPLCLDILAEAIIFEPDSSEFDPDRRFSNPRDILDFCRNLFSVSLKSFKEYLISERIKSDMELYEYHSVIAKGPAYIQDTHIQYWKMASQLYQYEPSSDLRGRGDYIHDNYPLLKNSVWSFYAEFCAVKDNVEQQQLEEQIASLYGQLATTPSPSLLQEVSLMQMGMADKITSVLCLLLFPILLNYGATDVLDFDNLQGTSGQYSPALEMAIMESLLLANPDSILQHISLLLQHGSLVNSPHYAGGSLLFNMFTKSYNGSRRLELIKLLLEYGAYLDPDFQRPDGLVDSFTGETVEYLACCNDLAGLEEAIAHDAKIGRPVRDPHAVVSLEKWPDDPQDRDLAKSFQCWSWNAFCAIPAIPQQFFSWYDRWQGDMFARRISFLIDHGGNINALDCVVGYEEGDVIHLEYCTALDFLQVLGRYWKEHKDDEEGEEGDQVSPSQYCFLAASILEDYGAKLLPRYESSLIICYILQF